MRKTSKIDSTALQKAQVFHGEVYNHIFKLATLKIKDPHFRNRRYNMFIIALHRYSTGMSYLWTNINPEPYSFYKNPIAISESKELVNLLVKQTEYIKKNEPEAYDYFRNKTLNYYLYDLLLFDFSSDIIYNDYFKNYVDCNNYYINLYGDTRTNLRKYLSDSNLRQYDKRLIDVHSHGVGLIEKEVAKVCPLNPHLDLLRKDVAYFAKYDWKERDKNLQRIKL